ncbi:hypothetical protein F511_30659 [Dorcoceras hygrometricum]|uniref:Uncharacterized protein n=1 Tax=Dorcoceras hygrometricum TaxID=472368 RepID=A0A2Z7BBA6_9LAMI|nr:hypothetical protein F511_30659 [Dorcoceras hygrometricum]
MTVVMNPTSASPLSVHRQQTGIGKEHPFKPDNFYSPKDTARPFISPQVSEWTKRTSKQTVALYEKNRAKLVKDKPDQRRETPIKIMDAHERWMPRQESASMNNVDAYDDVKAEIGGKTPVVIEATSREGNQSRNKLRAQNR